jgi:hypothetical protein
MSFLDAIAFLEEPVQEMIRFREVGIYVIESRRLPHIERPLELSPSRIAQSMEIVIDRKSRADICIDEYIAWSDLR